MERTKHFGAPAALLVALAAVLASLVALAAKPAGAAFPGTNGKIAFGSDRTTGAGVDNPTGDFEIFAINPDGTGLIQITNNTVDDYEPAYSPKGTTIAYVSYGVQTSNPEGDSEVYTINTDGSEPRNLTNNAASDYEPAFSPNGKQIAFSSSRDGNLEVYKMKANGKKQKRLTENDVYDAAPSWSPDGKWIAYESLEVQTSNPEGDFEVYTMKTNGTEQTNLTNNEADIDDRAPDYSPDGEKIAYQSYGVQSSNPEGDDDIYSMNALNGSDPRNLTNTAYGIYDRGAAYSPDGAGITYHSQGSPNAQASNPEGEFEVYVMDANGSGQKNLTNTDGTVDDESPNWQPIKG